MNGAETASRLEMVLKAVASEPNGAPLIDVAAQIWPPAPQRNVQRWLGMLIEQNRIVRGGDARRSRYKIVDAARSDDVPNASVVGQAVWRLVSRPLTERMPAQYHRDWLDAYRPN